MKKIQKKNITLNYLKQIYTAFRSYDLNEDGKGATLSDFSRALVNKNIKEASDILSLYVIGDVVSDKETFTEAVEKFGSQLHHISGAGLSREESRFDKYYSVFKCVIAA